MAIERLESRTLLAVVSGSVQRSVDAVGLDPNDPLFGGIPGVTVQLRDQAGVLITQQVTDADGNYSFPGVTAGRRQVSLVCPSAYLGTSAQSLSYQLTWPHFRVRAGIPVGGKDTHALLWLPQAFELYWVF